MKPTIWVLRDDLGNLIPETADTDKRRAWCKSFDHISIDDSGFNSRFWKRWDESIRAAKRRGFVLVKAELRPCS